MTEVLNWIVTHPGEAFLVYVVFMAIVQTMPRPTEKSSQLYVWGFQCAHLLAVNLKLVFDPLKGKPLELEENRKAAEQASRQP